MVTQDQGQENVQEQAVAEITENAKVSISEAEQRDKAEINGLNRRISELDKALKDKELAIEEAKKATMAESERREYELQQRENEVVAAKQNLVKSDNKSKALKFMSENNIAVDLIETISLDNWDTVQANLEIMKSVIDTTKIKTLEEFKTNSGHVPAAGGGNMSGGVVTQAMLKTMSAAAIDKAMR